MINPCEGCTPRNRDFIQTSEEGLRRMQTTMNETLSAGWDATAAVLAKAGNIPSDADPAQVAAIDQTSAYVADRTARLIGISFSIFSEFDDGLMQIETTECNDLADGCPKAAAMAQLMIRVSDSYIADI